MKMGFLDIFTKGGKMKKAAALSKAIYWTEIQDDLKRLTFSQFKQVVFPVIQMFQEEED